MEPKLTIEEVIKLKHPHTLSLKEGQRDTLSNSRHIPLSEEDVAYLFLCDLVEKGFLSEELRMLLTEGG